MSHTNQSTTSSRGGQARTYKYVQSYNQTIQVLGDADPTPGARGAIVFQLSSLGNYAALSQLYDLARINLVEVEFLPSFSDTFLAQAVEGFGSTNPIYRLPYVHSAIDYSNTTFPATAAVLEEYGTYKRTKGNASHKRVFTPAASVALVQPGSVSIAGSSAMFSPWIDMQTGTLQLAGLRYYIDSPTSESIAATVPLLVNVRVTIHLECKNVL